MKYTLRITPAAEADVDEAASFIAKDSLNAAFRFYDAVELTYRELRDHPARWPLFELPNPRLIGIRKRAVIGFHRFIVFYRIEVRVVLIIRVLHGAEIFVQSSLIVPDPLSASERSCLRRASYRHF